MPLKQVQSYQTSDNKLHASKGDALKHEFVINVRGILQRNPTAKATDCVNHTQMGQIIGTNLDEFFELISKQRAALKREESKELENNSTGFFVS